MGQFKNITGWLLFQEGIDKLEITDDGVRLEGVAEFREAVHARDISAIEVRGRGITN